VPLLILLRSQVHLLYSTTYLANAPLSGIDGKDGNPLNEVKILCNSILNNNNIMTADNVGKIAAFAGVLAT
jgi:hypothetical protein